jgi:hypothetical protein
MPNQSDSISIRKSLQSMIVCSKSGERSLRSEIEKDEKPDATKVTFSEQSNPTASFLHRIGMPFEIVNVEGPNRRTVS